MERRYHMRNNNLMIEEKHTQKGRDMLVKYRKKHTSFKGKHIRSVIQAYPDLVKCGRVYQLDESRGG